MTKRELIKLLEESPAGDSTPVTVIDRNVYDPTSGAEVLGVFTYREPAEADASGLETTDLIVLKLT